MLRRKDIIIAGFLALSIQGGVVFAVNKAPLEKSVNAMSKELYRKISDKNAVLVMSFQNIDGQPSHLGDYLSEQVRVALANMPKITVLDRKSIDVLLSERRLAESGLVNEKSAISFGKALGAKTVLFGTLANLDKNLRLTVKIVDIEKGVLSGGEDFEIKKSKDVQAFLKAFPEAVIKTTESKDNDLNNYDIKIIRHSKKSYSKVESFVVLSGPWDSHFPTWQRVMGPRRYEDVATYTFNFKKGEYGNDISVIKSLAHQQASELGCTDYFYVSSDKNEDGDYSRVTYHCYRSRCYDEWKKLYDENDRIYEQTGKYWATITEDWDERAAGYIIEELAALHGELSSLPVSEEFKKVTGINAYDEENVMDVRNGAKIPRAIVIEKSREYAAQKYIQFFQKHTDSYKKERDALLAINAAFETDRPRPILFPFPGITSEGEIETKTFHSALLSYLSANNYDGYIYSAPQPCYAEDIRLDKEMVIGSDKDPLAIHDRRGQ